MILVVKSCLGKASLYPGSELECIIIVHSQVDGKLKFVTTALAPACSSDLITCDVTTSGFYDKSFLLWFPDPDYCPPDPLQSQLPVFQMKPNFQELYVDGTTTDFGKDLYVAPAELPPPPRPPMPGSALYRSASISGSAAITTTVIYPETLGHLV